MDQKSAQLSDIELKKAAIRQQVELQKYKKDYIKELAEKERRERDAQEKMSKLKSKKMAGTTYKKKLTSYYFITINPNDCTVSDIEHIIEKLSKKPYFVIQCYTLEQRGITPDELGKGKHIHMIVDKTKPKSELLRLIHSSINKYCTEENIDIRKIDAAGRLASEAYMYGLKHADKIPLVKMDILWRKQNNLKNMYRPLIPNYDTD